MEKIVGGKFAPPDPPAKYENEMQNKVSALSASSGTKHYNFIIIY
jgi:hypothetical protein